MRILEPPKNKSFFLLGPRGVGKTTWLRARYKKALYFDLLENDLFVRLLADPSRLARLIPEKHKDWIILDEIQKVPHLLDEVHRLIESRKLKFILTGSSARKLRQSGVNLLAGRALTYEMYPLTTGELKNHFVLEKALLTGQLPSVYVEDDPDTYLKSYIGTYLKEEVQQEGMTRNLASFARFLEAASFSQGSILNIASVARDCSVERKVVEEYFNILEDLLIAYRIPVFTHRAKRKLQNHPKFYYFDVGVFRSIRPIGPLENDQALNGVALESLFLQELKALNSYLRLDYQIYYWRTQTKKEVDFVLYGKHGFLAFEVKTSARVRTEDLEPLRIFLSDYPQAKAFYIYGGDKEYIEDDIHLIPAENGIRNLRGLISPDQN